MSERYKRTSEQVNRQASGLVLTSGFLVVLDHCSEPLTRIPRGEEPRRFPSISPLYDFPREKRMFVCDELLLTVMKIPFGYTERASRRN